MITLIGSEEWSGCWRRTLLLSTWSVFPVSGNCSGRPSNASRLVIISWRNDNNSNSQVDKFGKLKKKKIWKKIKEILWGLIDQNVSKYRFQLPTRYCTKKKKYLGLPFISSQDLTRSDAALATCRAVTSCGRTMGGSWSLRTPVRAPFFFP